ncbi:hypothetical protein CSUI_008265 [Cystoisospora suis]|uniref:Uncharacterized protein n=1 Tax=Cystoisospora suis TaxID=483139 RepID=A0A2C6JPP4_9APIC|nr:hypothetical protein CSUI_008265 [Cystoisospora suis]
MKEEVSGETRRGRAVKRRDRRLESRAAKSSVDERKKDEPRRVVSSIEREREIQVR